MYEISITINRQNKIGTEGILNLPNYATSNPSQTNYYISFNIVSKPVSVVNKQETSNIVYYNMILECLINKYGISDIIKGKNFIENIKDITNQDIIDLYFAKYILPTIEKYYPHVNNISFLDFYNVCWVLLLN